MKVRDKTVFEALRFEPTDQPWPEGVERFVRERIESTNGETETTYAWKVLLHGTWFPIRPGQWVLYNEKGDAHLVAVDYAINNMYERVGGDAEPAPEFPGLASVEQSHPVLGKGRADR